MQKAVSKRKRDVNNHNGGDLRTAWPFYHYSYGQGVVAGSRSLPAVRGGSQTPHCGRYASKVGLLAVAHVSPCVGSAKRTGVKAFFLVGSNPTFRGNLFI